MQYSNRYLVISRVKTEEGAMMGAQVSTLKSLAHTYLGATEFAYACHWTLGVVRLLLEMRRFIEVGGMMPLWADGVIGLCVAWTIFLFVVAACMLHTAVNEVRSL